jgi:hypothetical protein
VIADAGIDVSAPPPECFAPFTGSFLL